jgi:hypothetical protein
VRLKRVGKLKKKKKIHLIDARIRHLRLVAQFLFLEYWGVESILGPLGTAATPGLLYLPRVIVEMENLVE